MPQGSSRVEREEAEKSTFSYATMSKIKPISPSMREKKRYVAAEVITQGIYDNRAVQRAIIDSYTKLCGSMGAARAGLLFLKDRTKTRVLMRVSTKELNNLKMSLTLVKQIGQKPAIIQCVGVSGTLKKIREKYMGENNAD